MALQNSLDNVFPEPDRTDVLNFAENIYTQERTNASPVYDLRIGAASVSTQNDSAYISLPITLGVQLISTNSRPMDEPEAVDIPELRDLAPNSFSRQQKNINDFLQLILIGDISSENRYTNYGYELGQVARGNATLDQYGVINVMTKVPKVLKPSLRIRMLCALLSRMLVSATAAPITIKHVTYMQHLAFNRLWGTEDKPHGFSFHIKGARHKSLNYPVRSSDFNNWVWSTNIWQFLNGDNTGLSLLLRLQFLASIYALNYGKKPQTRGEFSSLVSSSKALIPDDNLPEQLRDDGLWYEAQYFSPHIQWIGAALFYNLYLWAILTDDDIEELEHDLAWDSSADINTPTSTQPVDDLRQISNA